MFGFIIGPKGETIQKLQKETSTTVVIPRNKNNNQKSRAGQSNRTYQNESITDLEILEPTVITAVGPNHQKNIRKANLRIDLILHKNRSKLPFTHYIALNFYKNKDFVYRIFEQNLFLNI